MSATFGTKGAAAQGDAETSGGSQPHLSRHHDSTLKGEPASLLKTASLTKEQAEHKSWLKAHGIKSLISSIAGQTNLLAPKRNDRGCPCGRHQQGLRGGGARSRVWRPRPPMQPKTFHTRSPKSNPRLK
jgi:hypothetical protein